MRLKDKVAIITASGSGMGRASAILFAKEGAQVVVADINVEKGEETVKTIREAGGEASFFRVDVSDLSLLKQMIDFTVDKYGKINILYNHAGTPGPAGVEEVEEKDWDEATDLNIKGAFFATKYALPEIKKQGAGSIIFTASISGLVGSISSPVYSAVKGAVVNLTRALATRYASENIRVNCICPGAIETPMFPQFMGRPGQEHLREENTKKLSAGIPMKRVGQPEEIAATALFLASDESSYITGVILPVDGGYVAQ